MALVGNRMSWWSTGLAAATAVAGFDEVLVGVVADRLRAIHLRLLQQDQAILDRRWDHREIH